MKRNGEAVQHRREMEREVMKGWDLHTHTRMTKRGSRRTWERDWMPRVTATTTTAAAAAAAAAAGAATANERYADFFNVKKDRKERKKK